MNPTAVPVCAAAALLVVAGAIKIGRPGETHAALRTAGVRVPAALVRLGGAGELAVGGWALLFGTAAADLLVAACYLGFASFILVTLRRGTPLPSCGCLGGGGAPTRAHAGVDLIFAATAVAALAGDPTGLLRWAGSAGGLIVDAGLALLVAWLSWMATTLLSELRRDRRVHARAGHA